MTAKQMEWIEMHPVLFKGQTVTVRKVLLGETSQIQEYWDELGDKKQTKVTAILNLLDNKKGQLANEEKFKKLEDYQSATFYEIKAHQVRIGCVWEPGYNLMLLFGFNKKKDEWKAGELKQLKNIYDRYDERKKAYLLSNKGAPNAQ